MHLYLHIPFCHRICPYCSFYKHTPADTDLRAFIDAIGQEAQRAVELHKLPISGPDKTGAGHIAKPIPTLYLGGGTPSMLSPSHLRQLFTALNDVFDLSQTHITLEANPATFGPSKAALFKTLGVNRTSLGIQSFSPHVLKTLGREHTAEQAAESVKILRQAGMEEINIDLMFAIPGQTNSDWQHTLDTAVSLAPDHISAYNLTYEEDTAFIERLQQGQYNESEDINSEQFQQAHLCLNKAGFEHYETSNYARPGKQSQHNLAYWQGHNYLGLGPSAVSTLGEGDQRQRWKNLPDTARYIQAIQTVGHAMSEIETIDNDAFRIERIALLLRTSKGLPVHYLEDSREAAIDELLQHKLAEISNQHLKLINSGPQLVDPIASQLI